MNRPRTGTAPWAAALLALWMGALAAPAGATGGAPTAAAGQDVYTLAGRTIILDGSASSDPEAEALNYLWHQVDGPPIQLIDETTANPWFEGVEVGTYGFGLVVDDGTSTSGEDQVEVHLFPDTEHDFYLEQGCSCGVAGGSSARGAAGPLALLLAWGRRRPGR